MPPAVRALAIAVLGALSLSACSLTVDCGPGKTTTSCIPPPEYVYVLNQGTSAEGNGTLARYDLTGFVETDSTASLGAALQSVAQGFYDGHLYVTAPAANRIDVFQDGDALTRIARISVERPRYMAFVSGAKLYVTTQPNGRPAAVSVINTQTGATMQTVEVGGLAEGIAVVGERAYVATGASGASQVVVVLNTMTDTVLDRIDVGCAPRLVLIGTVSDVEGADAYVVCSGTAADEVVVLDGETGAIERRLAVGGAVSVTATGQVADLGYADSVFSLFVLRANGTVAQIPATGGAVTTIEVGGDAIGGIAYTGAYGRLFVMRAPGPDANGYVTVHRLTGELTGRFSSGGIAPGQLVFPASVLY